MNTAFRSISSRSALAVILFNALPLAQGAGFYISEVGTPGSLGTAGVANPVNNVSADAAWTNPAGMTGVKGDHALAGMQVVVPKVEFDPSSSSTTGGDDGGNAGNVAVIPSFFATKQLTNRLHAGFAITAPLGGAMNFGDDFAGRYTATKVELTGIGISPSLGYKVNERLSVGAGVSILYTQFEQKLALRQTTSAGAPLPDGKIKMENLDDWGYQPFAGLTWAFSDKVLLGAVYRAEADVDLKGDLNFRNVNGPVPSANKVKIGWDNPQTLKAGLRIQVSDERTLMFSAGWEDWSAFSENAVSLDGGVLSPVAVLDRNFQDTWNVGAAIVQRTGGNAYSLGISYDSSPVEDEDRTIDLPFDETVKLSAAWVWEGDKQLNYGLGATLAYLGEGKIENQHAQGLNFDGKFDTNYVLFLGGTVRYEF